MDYIHIDMAVGKHLEDNLVIQYFVKVFQYFSLFLEKIKIYLFFENSQLYQLPY